MYQAARAMMDRSAPGQVRQSPSTAQKVPKADSSVPTRSCRALRGMRSTVRRASAPTPPMTTRAAAAAGAAVGDARGAARERTRRGVGGTAARAPRAREGRGAGGGGGGGGGGGRPGGARPQKVTTMIV